MRRIGRSTALLSGMLTAAAGAQRPEAPTPVVPTAAPQTKAPPTDAPPPADARGAADPLDIVGPDGEPLPPDLRRMMEEELRRSPPPAASGAGNTGTAAASAPTPPGSADEVVVAGRRPRGSVVGNVPAQRSFSPLDLRAYGANDVGELLQALSPQTSSVQGREDGGPVVLLNGKRVSSFAEIQKIPTEAIERVEVFPEELALRYGYRADQKVVNVVVYERFTSKLLRLSYSTPTEGGRDTPGLNANLLRLQGDLRLNLDVDYASSGYLRESERAVAPGAGIADDGRFRSLLPATERATVNGTASGEVLSGTSSTINAKYETSDSRSLLGSGPDSRALRRDVDVRTIHLGTTSGGAIAKWSWTLTGNYDRARTDTTTAVAGRPTEPDVARGTQSSVDADLLASGVLVDLPAGPASASVRTGVARRWFDATSRIGGLERRTDLERGRGAIQGSLDVPIASRERNRLATLGALTINANAVLETLSDFGTLRTFGYGAVWSPRPAVNVIASVTDEQGAPSVEQLGAPAIATPNVRIFDARRGEVVEVVRTFGGNRALRADDRHVRKLGVVLRPLAATDLNLVAEYVDTRIDDPILPIPLGTSSIEAALPERFSRDTFGRLTAVDASPLNFERLDQKQFRWGLNLTRPLGPVPNRMRGGTPQFVPSAADLKRSLPAGARILTPPPGSAAAMAFENAASRLTVSLYHTWRIEDRLLVRRDGPVLDLLDGDAVDARGGRSRHGIEAQVGAFKRGLGAQITANWQSPTTVNAGAAGGADLRFSYGTIVNLNLFANLAERFRQGAPGWLGKTRINISVNNVLNRRPRVRDAGGGTPLNLQSAFLDPLGRSVSVSLRKLF